jgi:hypothetical protein
MRTTQKTLANALAYIAITGSRKHLRLDTCVSTGRFTDLRMAGGLFIGWMVNDEGMKIAKTSKLWKAHERATSQGFKVDDSRRVRPSFIIYRHPDTVSTKHGERHRTAFISRGSLYADRLTDDGVLRPELMQ